MKKLGFFCMLFMIALSACRDNVDTVDETEVPFEPPIVNWNPQNVPVNSSLTGFVVDATGQPVSDANVQVGNMSTTTDDYGHFFYNDVTLNAKGTVVTVEKSGYFDGSRRFLAIENETNRVKIELITKAFDYSFNAAAGGTVETTDGATIVFPPNSIKKNDGTIYTGDVRVAAEWLDPSDVATLDRMPGNLQGVDSNVEEVALGTYGMVAVELESEAGEALNISEGNTATLSMPVPTSLQGSAPAEIPLWSYSEEHGVWVEESSATLSNGVYTGEVSHFSFWNCDYPYPLIELTAMVIDENGDPLSNYQVVVSLGAFSGYAYTGPDGTFSGLIPANEDLVLEIYGICDELLYSQNIGPFSDDEDLGTIGIDASFLLQTTITGDLVDCDGEPVQNGLLILEFDNKTIYEYVSGSFNTTFGTCTGTTDITLTGLDLDALIQSDPITVPANTSTPVGNVEACDVQLENFIKVVIDDGTNTTITVYSPSQTYPDSLSGGGLDATAFSFYDNNTPTGGSNIYFAAGGDTTGDYSTNHSIISFQDLSNSINLGQGQTFDYFIIDEYGNWGESVNGTFGGTMTNYGVQPPVTVTVTGTFDIIR